MNRPDRVLALRGGALGDFVLTLPALTHLRALFPRCQLELAAYPHGLALARAGRVAETGHSLDDADWSGLYDRPPGGAARLGRRLAGIDLAVSWLRDPEGWAAANLRAAGVSRVIRGTPPTGARHAVDELLAPLAPFGPGPAEAAPRLPLDHQLRRRGNDWWTDRAKPGRGVLIHPGSGSPTKNWPADRFPELAAELSRRGWQPVVLLGPAEVERGWRWPGPGVSDPLELPLLAAVLAEAAGYVGHDSGVTHLAAAVGAAGLALFGPTDPAIWGPRGGRLRVIQAAGGRLNHLTPAEVLSAWDRHPHLARGPREA